MKSLKDNIIEKLSIDDINIGQVSEFPNHFDLNQIKKFLKDNGFIEIIMKQYNFSELLQEFNKEFSRVFVTSANSIRFADTTNEDISKDNPIYVVTCSGALKGYGTEYSTTWENRLKKDAFMQEINKKFGF